MATGRPVDVPLGRPITTHIPGSIWRKPGQGPLERFESRQLQLDENLAFLVDVEGLPPSEARLMAAPNRPGLTPDHG